MRARIAAAVVAALTASACSSGGSKVTTNPVPLFSPSAGTTAPVTANQVRIVGVGDSLTAGVQSGGLLGQQIPGGASAGSAGTLGNVQETQEHGFFALVWEQANGVAQSVLENPATSPLPLIKATGIGGVLAKTSSGFPAGITTQCAGLRGAAFSPSGALTARLNSTIQPFDVAIPGQTTHEVVAMYQPLSACIPAAQQAAIAGIPGGAQQLALNSLLFSESENFYPVLATFGSQVTQLQAATSLHGQYATVWIGSNDLLHFAFANGGSPPADPTAIGNDIATIVTQLQQSGAKPALANLVDVLGASTFFPVPIYATALQTAVTNAIVGQTIAGAAAKGVTLTPAQAAAASATTIAGAKQAAAAAAAAQIARAGLGNGGLIVLPTYLSTVGAILTQQPIPVLDAPGTGSNGAGQYVSDSVVATVRQLNQAYNQAIAGVAKSTGVPLVDVASTFAAAEAATQAGQPYLIPGSTAAYVSLQYGGGFTSLDGLHPSNTGYAATANQFITAFNTAYGTKWPLVNVDAVYAADPYAPQNFQNPFVALSSIQRTP